MRIHGFIHCAMMGNWREVLTSQFEKIKSSGLLDKTEKISLIYVNVNNDDVPPFLDKKVFLQKGTLSYKFGEYPTLYYLQKTHKEYDYAWYVHTKGVSKFGLYPWEKVNRIWRKLMEETVILKHEDCISALNDHDMAGIFYRNVFLGNFWWARSSYIEKLIDINEYCKKNVRKSIRYRMENWPTLNNPKVKCFLDFPMSHVYYWGSWSKFMRSSKFFN